MPERCPADITELTPVIAWQGLDHATIRVPASVDMRLGETTVSRG